MTQAFASIDFIQLTVAAIPATALLLGVLLPDVLLPVPGEAHGTD